MEISLHNAQNMNPTGTAFNISERWKNGRCYESFQSDATKPLSHTSYTFKQMENHHQQGLGHVLILKFNKNICRSACLQSSKFISHWHTIQNIDSRVS